MDGKGAAVKMKKAVGLRTSIYPDHVQGGFPLEDVFERVSDPLENSTGLTELLAGVLDYDNPYYLDMAQVPYTRVQLMGGSAPAFIDNVTINNQQPGTPNSSSVSSASSDAVNDEGQVKVTGGEDEDGNEQKEQKKSKELRPKKGNQKKLKQPRFAFMTKSEVDHLEDGYRWRKYGQKAVKNSPFPRSYYHCTTTSCNVKKRVERSFSDPTIVVTTYEGQHTHPSPVTTRPTYAGIPLNHGYTSAGAFGILSQRTPFFSQQLPQSNLLDMSVSHISSFGHNSSHLFAAPSQEQTLLKDNGLLQDLVKSHMFKKEF